MEHLFPQMYVQGYTAALQDVIRILTNIQPDLKFHKRKQNAKTYIAILNCMLENRCVLRENPKSFIRCNDSVPGGFEVFVEK